MNSLLSVSIVCLLKLSLISSIPIEYNKQKGIFLTEEESKTLLLKAEVELPALKEEFLAVKKQLEIERSIKDDIKKAGEIELKISEVWKKNYELSLKEIELLKRKERMRLYIFTGLFVGGTLLGASTMYISSMLVKNVNISGK